ncbi:MAG: permease-like cell division protein FtsX [Bacteroidota bacterium]
MSLSYTVRESLSGFSRAKLSSTLSILTVCVSLLLLGLFVAVTVNASRLVDALRSRLEMEAFLEEPLTDEEITALNAKVSAVDGVEKVIYISKDEAALIFKQEFGEDISSVLDFNPLPPSFKITLKPAFRTSAGTQRIHDKLAAIDGIESVVYRKALLELIDQRAAGMNKILLGLGVLISLSAVFLVSNTIRLAIYAKKRIIRTMELVGATRGFIRRPFMIEGILQGILGGLLAAGVMAFILEYASRLVTAEFAPYLRMPTLFYAGVVAAGIALGLVGSLISVLRFVRPAAAG